MEFPPEAGPAVLGRDAPSVPPGKEGPGNVPLRKEAGQPATIGPRPSEHPGAGEGGITDLCHISQHSI